jgi:hypothetical protein
MGREGGGIPLWSGNYFTLPPPPPPSLLQFPLPRIYYWKHFRGLCWRPQNTLPHLSNPTFVLLQSALYKMCAQRSFFYMHRGKGREQNRLSIFVLYKIINFILFIHCHAALYVQLQLLKVVFTTKKYIILNYKLFVILIKSANIKKD